MARKTPSSPPLRRVLAGNFSLWLGLGVIALWILLALLVPWFGLDPNTMRPQATLAPPGPPHWLGTDNFGRDILARTLWGSRITLLTALAAAALAAVLGSWVGVMAAVFGGWLDALLMRIVDVIFAFPAILGALAIASISGGGIGSVILTVGIIYAPQFARISRAELLRVRELPFIEAAQAIGVGRLRLVLAHMLPNAMSAVLVQASLSLSLAILLESALSFLGLGIQPPYPSLGRMLNEATNYMMLSPWGAVFPGIAISTLVLGFNLVGDGLRDWLDPYLS